MNITYLKQSSTKYFSYDKNEPILLTSKYIFFADQDINKMRLYHKKEVQILRNYIFQSYANYADEDFKLLKLKQNDSTSIRNSHRKSSQQKIKNRIKTLSLDKKYTKNQKNSLGSLSALSINQRKNKNINVKNSQKISLKKVQHKKIKKSYINLCQQKQQVLNLFDESILATENDLSFSTTSQNLTEISRQISLQQQSTKQESIISQFDEVFKKIKISDYLKCQSLTS